MSYGKAYGNLICLLEESMDYEKSFAMVLLSAKKPTDFIIQDQTFKVLIGTSRSVNNQGGDLRDANLLGRELEFTLVGDGIEMPLVFQLYENTSGHTRLFLYSNKGMLFSVNLTTGYNAGYIKLEQLIKYSSRQLDATQRIKACQDSLDVLRRENIKIVSGKTVHLGTFDVKNKEFFDTTAERFLTDMIKVGLIKGHYSNNKGFSLRLGKKNENKSCDLNNKCMSKIDKLKADVNVDVTTIPEITYEAPIACSNKASNQGNTSPSISLLKKVLIISIFIGIFFWLVGW